MRKRRASEGPAMRRTLALLAPVLFPSWGFFRAVEPSPRIEIRHPDAPADWRPFRPTPARLSVGVMAARLFWNPRRNEDLFLASCAERLLEDGRPHARREIAARVRAELGRDAPFRLVTVRREGDGLVVETAFESSP
jgi:hypothetical protein